MRVENFHVYKCVCHYNCLHDESYGGRSVEIIKGKTDDDRNLKVLPSPVIRAANVKQIAPILYVSR